MAFKTEDEIDSRPVRLLICGGRDFNDWPSFKKSMAQYETEPAFIIHGGARGADSLAKSWALLFAHGHREFPAQWNKLGKAAGFRRNEEMLSFGKPDLVIAFPGGNGTAYTVKLAQDRGVTVRDVVVPNYTNWWEKPVFVFGSNKAGRHGKGAALFAADNFGAERGIGEGPTGHAYAIPTKDENLNPLPWAEVAQGIDRFLEYAATSPDSFELTPVGCGLAGGSIQRLAAHLRQRKVPPNVSPTASWQTDYKIPHWL